jgi:hypothetical protein
MSAATPPDPTASAGDAATESHTAAPIMMIQEVAAVAPAHQLYRLPPRPL